MGFIFKADQPFLSLAVNFHRNYNTAGIDLIRLLHIFQLAFFFQLAHSHQGHIHQAHIFIITARINFIVGIFVGLIGRFFKFFIVAVFKTDIFKLCLECCMAAMIRPVCIQHTDLSHRRIPFFFTGKVFLNELEVLKGHCQI